MKSIFIIFIISLFSKLPLFAKEDLIRPEKLVVLATLKEPVITNYRDRRLAQDSAVIGVMLIMHKGFGQNYVKIQVSCHSFPDDLTDFNESDVDAFIKAANAAKTKGELKISIKRGDTMLHFNVEEATLLKKAIREAQIGKIWYESLLTAKELPKETPKARPPKALSLSISSASDKVNANGVAYKIEAEANLERKKPRSRIVHGISYKHGSSDGGSWSKLLDGISDGVNAIEQNKDYKREEGSHLNYTLVANLKSKKVKLTYLVNKEENIQVTGYFGRQELDAINNAIKQAEVNGKWMIDHKEWFIK